MMIKIQNLIYRDILNNINLNIPQGSVLTIVGDNGSGKTTLLRSLLGLIKPDSGVVLFNDVLFKSNREEILKSIGALIESPSLYKHLTLEENLLYFSRLLNVENVRVQILMEQFKLTSQKNTKASNLSLGTKQKLGLAISLLKDPKIIVWDEPTNSLDKNSLSIVSEILTNANRNSSTIIVSTHNLSEFMPISGQIIRMQHGAII